MAQQTIQWRFERGDAGADEIQASVDEIMAQLANPASEVSGAARTAGIEPADLGDITVEVREDRQGAEPVLTAILVGIAVKAGSAAVEALWREVIWPRLRRRLGARALGERQAAATPTE
jgi:hypothetical protein